MSKRMGYFSLVFPKVNFHSVSLELNKNCALFLLIQAHIFSQLLYLLMLETILQDLFGIG